jgi:hypothetical protein
VNTTLTITTAAGPATLTIDIDPYDGEATLTADLRDGNAGTAHFGFDPQARDEAIAATLVEVERLIRANLAIAPWIEV